MYCSNCGNNIPTDKTYCPYCGTQVKNNPINNGYYQNISYNNATALRGGTNGMAVAGFVLALVFPFLGLIFSCIGLANSKYYYNHNGRGLSIAGIIISLIPLILVLLFVIGILSFISMA